MKSLLYIALLYLCLALLAMGCTKSAPVPACKAAEVVGQDCEQGWYLLKLEDDTDEAEGKSGTYVGQLQGGYVTTDNLPEQFRRAGAKVSVRLELNGSYGPTCVSTAMLYPAVRIVAVCGEDVR